MVSKKKTSESKKIAEGKQIITLVFDGNLNHLQLIALHCAVDKANSELSETDLKIAPPSGALSKRALILQAFTNAGGVPTAIIEAARYLPEEEIVKLILYHYQNEVKRLQEQVESLEGINDYLKKTLQSKLFPEGKPVELNNTEGFIIEALQRNTIIGEKLAEKAGYPYNSNFKNILSSLRKRGILGNENRSGYFLEPAYHYLIKPQKQSQDKGQD